MVSVQSCNSGHRFVSPYDFICSVLRGEDPCLPARIGEGFVQDFVSLAKAHRIEALVHYKAAAEMGIETWPRELRQWLSMEARLQAARELFVRGELVGLLPQFADAGIECLLVKGTPLAYLDYPEPFLRTRSDTDLLILEPQRRRAHEVLLAAGYIPSRRCEHELATYQCPYTRGEAGRAIHIVDLHWRLSDREACSRVFSHQELRESAVPVTALGPNALAPDPVSALLIACMHRIAHHNATPFSVDGGSFLEANRLIWLYDIHLLAEGLSEPGWSRFLDLAAVKGLRAVCLDGLRAASASLATGVPDLVTVRLAAPGAPELSAEHLKPGLLRRRLVDLRALPSWKRRLARLTKWSFPPADYMMKRYESRNPLFLPVLYLRRAGSGLRKMFDRRGK